MYIVEKEFAGIEKGTERNFTQSEANYLLKNGYIKAKKADPKPMGRKKKIDIEAEKLLNKSL